MDLEIEHVRGLLASLGVNAAQEDVQEVAYRINALLEALGSLEHPEVDAVEQLPVFWLREEA